MNCKNILFSDYIQHFSFIAQLSPSLKKLRKKWQFQALACLQVRSLIDTTTHRVSVDNCSHRLGFYFNVFKRK